MRISRAEVELCAGGGRNACHHDRAGLQANCANDRRRLIVEGHGHDAELRHLAPREPGQVGQPFARLLQIEWDNLERELGRAAQDLYGHRRTRNVLKRRSDPGRDVVHLPAVDGQENVVQLHPGGCGG